jgi:hypothetical protein
MLDDDRIRNRNGYISVIDIIDVICGQKNPHSTWKRLCGKNNDITTCCCDIKFPGPGQRETPCILIDKVYILFKNLLPGIRLPVSRKQEILNYFNIKDQLIIRDYIEEEIHEKLIVAFTGYECIKQYKVLQYSIE